MMELNYTAGEIAILVTLTLLFMGVVGFGVEITLIKRRLQRLEQPAPPDPATPTMVDVE